MSGTRFLNVDLDVASRDDLSPLVTALGDEVFVLHERRERGVHHVSFELTTQRARTAEACLRTFARLVEALPPRARRVWDRARDRSFDIGIEASPGAQFRTDVSTATLERIADLGGTIAITVYARPEPARRRSSRSPPGADDPRARAVHRAAVRARNRGRARSERRSSSEPSLARRSARQKRRCGVLSGRG